MKKYFSFILMVGSFIAVNGSMYAGFMEGVSDIANTFRPRWTTGHEVEYVMRISEEVDANPKEKLPAIGTPLCGIVAVDSDDEVEIAQDAKGTKFLHGGADNNSAMAVLRSVDPKAKDVRYIPKSIEGIRPSRIQPIVTDIETADENFQMQQDGYVNKMNTTVGKTMRGFMNKIEKPYAVTFWGAIITSGSILGYKIYEKYLAKILFNANPDEEIVDEENLDVTAKKENTVDEGISA